MRFYPIIGFDKEHNETNEFSGLMGDQGAAILTGTVYLATPGGETKYITREDAILAILEGVDVNTKARAVSQDPALDYTGGITEFDCGQNSAWQWFWGDVS